ncbi:hypothetical protein LCGC14_0706080 [marine sediment metagenome]|uniref:Methyltransferase domain-containing protein n=1 Tax=marine sediment metagenome TaxID=412755 RepID=A0A0F9R1V0_9ZZZZ|nr:hypothetical protein [bacterium]
MWESPFYRFRYPKNPNNWDSDELYEIVIDVSLTPPSQAKPAQSLITVLKKVFELYPNIQSVLDFGAGKLRVTPFLLKEGKEACAIEFEKTTQNKTAQMNLAKCQNYGNRFKQLVFPNQFLTDTQKFDLIILINVIPFMPIFAERIYLLSSLNEKLADNGLILWFAFKETPEYKKARRSKKFSCGDGDWKRSNARVKTFYKYHHPNELNKIFGICGFEIEKFYPNSVQDIRLYKKNKYNLMKTLPTIPQIKGEIPDDSSIKPDTVKLKIVKESDGFKKIVPNPLNLSIEQLFIKALKSMPYGTENANRYHRLISYIFGHIFQDQIRNMKFEEDLSGGIKRIDTTFDNVAQDGFFSVLPDKNNKINCPIIIIEAKNYEKEIKNPELDQLSGRLEPNCNLGISISRFIEHQDYQLKKCQKYLIKNEFILCLTDEDLIKLLVYYQNGLIDEITDIFLERYKDLVLKREKASIIK